MELWQILKVVVQGSEFGKKKRNSATDTANPVSQSEELRNCWVWSY